MRKELETPDVDWRLPGGGLDSIPGYATAMARLGPSVPVVSLKGLGYLGKCESYPEAPELRILDYGCGRGEDAEYLGADRWDPHWHPQGLDRRLRWDRVLLTYVLNVLGPAERASALLKAWRLVSTGGWLLVSIRGDVPKARPGRGGATQYPCAGWCRYHLPELPNVRTYRELRPGRTWAIQKGGAMR